MVWPPAPSKVSLSEKLEQLDDVEQVYKFHLFTGLRTGTIGVKDGPLMAAVDKFTISLSPFNFHRALRGHCEVNTRHPATVNHTAEAAKARAAAVKVVGEEGLRTGKEIMTMGGEDFSYFLNKKPGCFIFVGATVVVQSPHHITTRRLTSMRSLWPLGPRFGCSS